jgi:hypothetical protein
MCEELRVISRGPNLMTVRLVRTESLPHPEEWMLVANRMPDSWVEGLVGKMYFTQLELEYLQGKRDLT